MNIVNVSGLITLGVAIFGVLLELGLKIASRPNRSTEAESFWLRIKGRLNITPEDWVLWQQLLTMGSVACGTHIVAKAMAEQPLNTQTALAAILIAVLGFLVMTFLMRVGAYDNSGDLPPLGSPAWRWIHGLNLSALVIVFTLAMLGVMA